MMDVSAPWRLRWEGGAYGVLSVGLLSLPLVTVLHVESAAVMAGVAFFVAGTSAIGALSGGRSVGRVIAEQLGLLLIPLAALTLSTLWVPNCAYLTGLGFYLLFPVITVGLAVAGAYALTGTRCSPRAARWMLVGSGLAVAAGGPIYDLGFHPQFYTYNHVFGGVLGPIYDEQLALRPGLFVFRGLTLLWAGALGAVGARLRRGRWTLRTGGGLAACVLGAAVIYGWPAETGINTTPAHLQAELGGHRQTEHFDLYYDPSALTQPEVDAIAADHEAEHARMARQIGRSGAEMPRIQSYIYPSPDVKARLTGARYTSVSPVWLAEPQMHLLRSRIDDSFSHELAHVFSRPYGLPGLKASWAVGLVEGWAVALEAPTDAPSPHDLVAVAAASDTSFAPTAAGFEAALQDRAQGIAARLSPWGFWTGRGAVSYATMGSFVTYLLDTYGPEPLRAVYATANFQAVYGRSLDRLAADWAASLRDRPVVSAAAAGLVQRQFTRPSLFETECPHHVPSYRRQWQAGQKALAQGDSAGAAERFQEALATEPRFLRAHVDLARLRLAAGRVSEARRQLDTLRADLRAPVVTYALADAHTLEGDVAVAGSLYAETLAGLPRYQHALRTRVLLRDALADRSSRRTAARAALEILTGPDSAHVQAQRLAGLLKTEGSVSPDTSATAPVVRAWTALRWQDAYRFDAAATVWLTILPDGEPPRAVLPADRPAAWHEAAALQVQGWTADALFRSGHLALAQRLARDAAAHYHRLGATTTAQRLHSLANRAHPGGEVSERTIRQ